MFPWFYFEVQNCVSWLAIGSGTGCTNQCPVSQLARGTPRPLWCSTRNVRGAYSLHPWRNIKTPLIVSQKKKSKKPTQLICHNQCQRGISKLSPQLNLFFYTLDRTCFQKDSIFSSKKYHLKQRTRKEVKTPQCRIERTLLGPVRF